MSGRVRLGNITVSFAVLSYAGRLTIILVTDPDAWPDLTALRDARVAELGVLTRRPRDLWLWAQAEVGQMLGS